MNNIKLGTFTGAEVEEERTRVLKEDHEERENKKFVKKMDEDVKSFEKSVK
ncbi:MAG: hypothetical protein ISS82_00735 [Nanoarchaeota archaeon]|nr:hypothetical protein [Nanoarchaeota archaeon]